MMLYPKYKEFPIFFSIGGMYIQRPENLSFRGSISADHTLSITFSPIIVTPRITGTVANKTTASIYE